MPENQCDCPKGISSLQQKISEIQGQGAIVERRLTVLETQHRDIKESHDSLFRSVVGLENSMKTLLDSFQKMAVELKQSTSAGQMIRSGGAAIGGGIAVGLYALLRSKGVLP